MRRARSLAFVATVLLVVACSSASPGLHPGWMPVPSQDKELMSTRRPRVPAPPDSVLEIEPDRDRLPEATVLPVLPECLPPASGAKVVLEADGLRACWNRGGNFAAPPDACLWIGEDGSTRTGPAPRTVAPPAYPRTTVSADGKAAEVCLAADACKVLTPTLVAGQLVQQAELDDFADRVALLLENPTTGDGTVEIYDAHEGIRLASGARSARHDKGARHVIDFVGSAILWVRYPTATDSAIGELWKTKGRKLKLRKKLVGRIGQWGSIGIGRFVFTDDGPGAQIWDVRTARRLAKLEIAGLVDHDERASWLESGDASMLATADGAFALVAVSRGTVRVAFVDATGRRPTSTLVEIPQCD